MTRLIVAASLGALAAFQGGRAQTQDHLDEILRKAAAFIAAFERESPAVVSEETYRQVSSFKGVETVRTLRSDVLVNRRSGRRVGRLP